jgi:hypothetical protein
MVWKVLSPVVPFESVIAVPSGCVEIIRPTRLSTLVQRYTTIDPRKSVGLSFVENERPTVARTGSHCSPQDSGAVRWYQVSIGIP